MEETEIRAASEAEELLLYGMEIQGKILNASFSIDLNWVLIVLRTKVNK